MKASFAKVIGLALVLALMLSGCNLIEVNYKMKADEAIAAMDEAFSTVAASYEGGEITVAEAIGDLNMAYNEMAYMYYNYFGMEITQEDVHMLMQDVLTEHVRAEITAARFDEAHTLSDEQLALVEDDVEYIYNENYAGALDSAEGETDEERRENARVIMHELGLSRDRLYANILTSAKQYEMQEILRGEITEVSEDELRAAYDEKVNLQKSLYVDGSTFESDMCEEGLIICWQPEGYRTVKHILVIPEEAVQNAYTGAVFALEDAEFALEDLQAELAAANDDDIAEGERTAEEIQAEIDAAEADIDVKKTAVADAAKACLENVQAATDEIYARLEAGEDFDALIAEYGEDPGMKNEPTMSRGYCVSTASQNWEANFRDAAMALENIGDYSAEPVVSGSGVHIILYSGDIAGGEVDLEEVRAALTGETLETLKQNHCDATIEGWVAEANPSYDVAAFEAALSAE